jgi:hypothetical protein
MHMGWTIGVLGFDFWREREIFLFTTASRPALGPTRPPNQGVPGCLSLGVKRPGYEADYSSASMPRSRMRGAIPPLPQYAVMAWCLVKHRDNFTEFWWKTLLKVACWKIVGGGSQGNASWGWAMDGTASGSCPIAEFDLTSKLQPEAVYLCGSLQ